VAHAARLDFILEFTRVVEFVAGQVEAFDSDSNGGFVAGVVESGCVVEVLVGVVAVCDAGGLSEELQVLDWLVVGHGGDLGVHAVDFGLLNEHAGPRSAHNSTHTELVLDLLLVRGPAEAAFAFAAGLLVPRLELLDELVVVLV